MEKLYVDKNNLAGIENKIKSIGCCVIKGYVPKINIKKLNLEFENILNENKDKLDDPMSWQQINTVYDNTKKNNRCLRTYLNNEIINNKNYSIINNLFNTNYINSINCLVLSNWDNINRQVFIHEDYQNMLTNNTYPHFDKNRFLKYYICVNDMNKSNGCFKIVPFSLSKSCEMRKNSITNNIFKKGHKYYSGKEIEIDSMLDVECNAGDMIIFDTNCIHAGGNNFQKGKYRRVIRLHILNSIFK